MAEYIEREAAKDAVCTAILHDGIRDALKSCIDDIPAADVRPVVHGRWLPTKDDNKKRCSHCDVIHLIAQYPHGKANYCPNCGARMEVDNG